MRQARETTAAAMGLGARRRLREGTLHRDSRDTMRGHLDADRALAVPRPAGGRQSVPTDSCVVTGMWPRVSGLQVHRTINVSAPTQRTPAARCSTPAPAVRCGCGSPRASPASRPPPASPPPATDAMVWGQRIRQGHWQVVADSRLAMERSGCPSGSEAHSLSSCRRSTAPCHCLHTPARCATPQRAAPAKAAPTDAMHLIARPAYALGAPGRAPPPAARSELQSASAHRPGRP